MSRVASEMFLFTNLDHEAYLLVNLRPLEISLVRLNLML